MEQSPESIHPQEIALISVVIISGLLIGLFFLVIHGAQATAPQPQSAASFASQSGSSSAQMGAPLSSSLAGGGVAQPANQAAVQPASQAAAAIPLAGGSAVLGSSHLDLNALTQADNIDESDNVRWSLVSGTSLNREYSSVATGVDWASLRNLTTEGSFNIPAGGSWSFNDTYGNKWGYKNASGVLAGGQCALATAIKAAATKAGLVSKSSPHTYPIPGFTHDQTVNIWWDTYDLTIYNSTSHDLSFVWQLKPDGVDFNVTQ